MSREKEREKDAKTSPPPERGLTDGHAWLLVPEPCVSAGTTLLFVLPDLPWCGDCFCSLLRLCIHTLGFHVPA